MVAVFEFDGGQVLPILHPKGGQQQQAERAILLGQWPVHLDRGQAARLRNGGDLLGRLVDEDAHPLDRVRNLGDDPLDVVDANLALTAGENEAEQVDAQLDGQLDVLGPRVTADFDPGHRPLSSRTVASRSGARSNASPTRAASTPIRPSASMSARLS